MRKKFLKGVASFSVAAAICLAFGAVTASAATLDESKIKVDYENQKVVVKLKETVQEKPAESSEENLRKLIAQIETDVLSADAAAGDTVNFTVNEKAVQFGTEQDYVLNDGSKMSKVTISLNGNNAACFASDGDGLLERDGNTIKYAKAGSGINTDDLPKIKVKAENEDGSASVTETIALAVAPTKEPDKTDHQILFNVASVKNKVLKPSAWEVYDIEDDEVMIDITSLNTQKDNYVQIKGDVSKDPITLWIPATDKVKLKFDAYTGKAYFDKGADASKTANYEYRTEYSDWSEAAKLENIPLELYQERGAKLYFRLSNSKPEETVGEISAVETNKITGIKEKGATEDLLVYKTLSLPGKEIKVSIGKKANAPKASVNYAKGTVTIPSGALYRVNTEDGITDFSKTPTSGKLTLNSSSTGTDQENFNKLVAGGSLEVKKAGDSGKKKAESKIFQLAFPNAKKELEVTGIQTGNVENNIIVDPIEPADSAKKVTASVEEVKRGQTTTFKLKVKNDTAYNYEVVVGDKPAADKKGKVVKSGGKEISISKLTSGKAVWVRRSADQKKAEWATEYVQMGVIPAATPSAEEIQKIKTDLGKVAKEYIANWDATTPLEISKGNYSGVNDSTNKKPLAEIALKDVEWGTPTNYEVGEAEPKETIQGVTISAEVVNTGTTESTHFISEDDTVKVVAQPDADETLQVKVTLTKDGQPIDKTISIKFTA